jgi:hypothetical protein
MTSALDGGEWSASRPGRFTLKERAPGTHWIGGWVGPQLHVCGNSFSENEVGFTKQLNDPIESHDGTG